ncbi:hypothetical protein AVEN_67812-1 [Araneus ventricosus]|uniref:Uncharacterized protein n=1 Tax=Araneus ventricosus TaxID=182803 RepID=A0A4Y2S141_ARAVE|nr:hypothetical protein AVEN_66694-1 [Araneus ventricosus]GBN81306.1 hypothetical protein AVEN_67812-1 [Araneus ventricosus]
MKFEIPRVGQEDSEWQEFCDFDPCLKINFGTSVNALPNFSTKMGGDKPSLRTNGIASLLVNAQLSAGHSHFIQTGIFGTREGKKQSSILKTD